MVLTLLEDEVILKKCPQCKQKFRTRRDLEQLEKEVKKKNKCRCGSKLIADITENSERKRWFGYLSSHNSERINHMVLVENTYYDDGSAEARIPLLNLEFEAADHGSLISMCDDNIERYLKDTYHRLYPKSQSFVTPAYCQEDRKILHNTDVWWK